MLSGKKGKLKNFKFSKWVAYHLTDNKSPFDEHKTLSNFLWSTGENSSEGTQLELTNTSGPFKYYACTTTVVKLRLYKLVHFPMKFWPFKLSHRIIEQLMFEDPDFVGP